MSPQGSLLPTPSGSHADMTLCEQQYAETSAGIYMAFQPARFIHPADHSAGSCALTTRFHPYHDSNVMAVIFCDTRCIPGKPETPSVRWCGALRCPDFPQYFYRDGTIRGKGTFFFGKIRVRIRL